MLASERNAQEGRERPKVPHDDKGGGNAYQRQSRVLVEAAWVVCDSGQMSGVLSVICTHGPLDAAGGPMLHILIAFSHS